MYVDERMGKVEKVMRAHVKLIGDQETMLQHSFKKIQDDRASYAEVVKGSAEVMQKAAHKLEAIPSQGKEKTNLCTEKAIAGVFDDFLEKEKRKLNVVVHNLPEPTSELYAERVEADKEKFREVICGAMHLNVRVTKAYRVGKPGQEKPRLLIVGLENTEVKSDILKLAPQLRSTDLWKKCLPFTRPYLEREGRG